MRFEREQCLDLDAAFARTWILTDALGAVAAGSLLGCPASRYHGLLVAPAGPDGAPHVFLERLEEWLVEGERALPISSARYPGVVEPSGHTFLASFDAWPRPTWHYQVGDVEVTREIEFLPPPGYGVVIRWRVRAPRGAERRLRVRPFLACRPADALTFENPHADLRARPLRDGVRVQPYASLPPLSLRMSRGATFRAAPEWYRSYEHAQDLAAGREGREDHLTPGWFEIALRGSGEVVLVASIGRSAKEKLPAARGRRPARSASAPSLAQVLERAAQHHVRIPPTIDRIVTARLPWVGDDLAATSEALEPLLASMGQPATLLGMMVGVPDAQRTGGARLELLWSRGWLAGLETRGLAASRPVFLERLFQLGHALREESALDPVAAGSGLISGSAEPGAPRLDVGINTRWVALAHALARLTRGASKRVGPERQGWAKTAREVAHAFRERFWLEDLGYLADGWADGEPDKRVRPGMLVAAAEPAVPLSKAERLSILERARVELLTPRGLRTLSPRDPAYSPDPGPRAPQPPGTRQGAVEPRWLLPYAQATLLARGRSPAVKKRLRALVEGFEPHLSEHGLGCVAEVFDGEAPHRASGAPSDVRSIVALLEILRLTGRSAP